MKYAKYILAAILLISLLAGLIPRGSTKRTEYFLDTVITITAYGKNAKKAVGHAFDEIKRLDSLLSAFASDSEVAKINESASSGFVSVDSEVFSLIKTAVYLSEKTDGAFDITLKPVSDLWGIGTENSRVPTDGEINEALKKTGYKNLELDDTNSAVRFKIPGMAIDLGAIAKGYVSSRAADILKENGVKSALLDLGGNVSVIGKRPISLFEALKNGSFLKPFIIGIQNPEGARGEIIHTLTANEDIFVITSGSYERYFEKDGIRYHHIIDPKTGKPAESGIISATIAAKDGALGDALSTAAFVLGESGAEKIRNLCDELILIDNDLNVTEYRKD